MKLAIVTEIPAPFRIPLFNALAARADVDPLVLFLALEDPRRPHYRIYEREFRFRWRVLPGRAVRRGGSWVVLSHGTAGALRRFRPRVVLAGGWNQPAFWSALGYARTHRVPLLCWVESTLRDERPGAAPLGLAKRLYARSAAGFVVPGEAAAEYVRSIAGEDAEIAVAPNAVDTELFARARVDRRGRGECTFLYVGRLDAEKGLDVLVRAFERVPGRLVLVGDGTEADRLRAAAGDRVELLGARERDELPEIYASADVFVLPSLSEPWGMVLLEAAAAGLPLVTSDAAGAAREAVEDGANGFVVAAGDETALASALQRLANDETLRVTMGSRSAELASRFSGEAWAVAVADLASQVSTR